MSQVVDVDFRPVVAKKTPPVFMGEILGEPRIAPKEKQPKHIGFRGVIHMPLDVYKKLDINTLKMLETGQVEIEARKPLFLRTSREFVRLKFLGGDSFTPVQTYNRASALSKSVYKNW